MGPQRNNSTRCTMEIVRTSVRRLAHRSPSSFRTAGALVSANLFQFHNAILFAPGQIAVEAVARVFSRINAPQQQSRSKFEKVGESSKELCELRLLYPQHASWILFRCCEASNISVLELDLLLVLALVIKGVFSVEYTLTECA